MYNVLIVDDEKMIREDVKSLLAMEEDLELDLVTAASAVEAKEIFETRKIDIAVMDINMPQMTGLELFDIVRERWPHCKVIFLTGYSDFEYVYKVHQHAKYVLKAEDDEKLIDAVRDSITELENSLLLEQLSEAQQLENRDPYIHERSMFLRDLFMGYRSLSQLTPDLAEQLNISINIAAPVYYVALRHDQWYLDSYKEQQKLAQDLYSLIEKYFFGVMQGAYFEYDKNYLLLIAQPKKLQNAEAVVHILEGSAELFQRALYKNIGRRVSILIGESPLQIDILLRNTMSILDHMVWMSNDEISIGSGPEEDKESTDAGLPDAVRQSISQEILRLEYAIDGLDEKTTLDLMQQLRDGVAGVRSMHDLFVLESYSRISAQLLSCIKRLGIFQELAFSISTKDLCNVSAFSTWRDAFGYLQRVAENIFALRSRNVEKKTVDVVDQIKSYISEHLDGDTSLYTLADQVHFSQEYLLRTFKKKEGITILQYINDMKLDAARSYLTDTDLPVREIAEKLGFTSQGYFGKFFRSKTGMTPNAYRETR